MNSYKLRPDLLLLLCGLTLLGCNRNEAPKFNVNPENLMTSLDRVSVETETAVQAAVSNAVHATRAIVFVHVDWAPMKLQRARFVDFMIEYDRTHPALPVMFHYVDCTPVTDGYGPLKSLPGWQKLQDAAGSSLIHGEGELVWMEGGRVLHVERILNFGSVPELVHKTEVLMSSDRAAKSP